MLHRKEVSLQRSFQSRRDCEPDPVDCRRRHNECLTIVQSVERSRGNILHGHDTSAVTGMWHHEGTRKGKSIALGTRTKYLAIGVSSSSSKSRRIDIMKDVKARKNRLKSQWRSNIDNSATQVLFFARNLGSSFTSWFDISLARSPSVGRINS